LIISKLAINSKNSLLFLLIVKNNIITFDKKQLETMNEGLIETLELIRFYLFQKGLNGEGDEKKTAISLRLLLEEEIKELKNK